MAWDSEKFWKIIDQINWASAIKLEKKNPSVNAVELAQQRYLTAVPDPEVRKQFETEFRRYLKIINTETDRRLDAEIPVFALGVLHGADDCFFMDLPAHLIGKGQKTVQGYLDGNLVTESPVECLTYIFQPNEE